MFYLYLLAGLLSVNAENVGVYIQTSWYEGFKGYIRLAPVEDFHGWKIRVKFNAAVGSLEVQYLFKSLCKVKIWEISSPVMRLLHLKILFVGFSNANGNADNSKVIGVA